LRLEEGGAQGREVILGKGIVSAMPWKERGWRRPQTYRREMYILHFMKRNGAYKKDRKMRIGGIVARRATNKTPPPPKTQPPPNPTPPKREGEIVIALNGRGKRQGEVSREVTVE